VHRCPHKLKQKHLNNKTANRSISWKTPDEDMSTRLLLKPHFIGASGLGSAPPGLDATVTT